MNPDKSSLRREIRRRLGLLPVETRRTASEAIGRDLAAWSRFRQARVIALFHPMPTEPDLLPLLRIPDKTFLFPLCHPDRTLSWHAPVQLTDWKPGPFGIIQPDPALSPALAPDIMELVLVPGLAFTAAGDRLGHGAGYYDRFLGSLGSGVLTAGVCFSIQLEPALPADPHDIRVQHLFHA